MATRVRGRGRCRETLAVVAVAPGSLPSAADCGSAPIGSVEGGQARPGQRGQRPEKRAGVVGLSTGSDTSALRIHGRRPQAQRAGRGLAAAFWGRPCRRLRVRVGGVELERAVSYPPLPTAAPTLDSYPHHDSPPTHALIHVAATPTPTAQCSHDNRVDSGLLASSTVARWKTLLETASSSPAQSPSVVDRCSPSSNACLPFQRALMRTIHHHRSMASPSRPRMPTVKATALSPWPMRAAP